MFLTYFRHDAYEISENITPSDAAPNFDTIKHKNPTASIRKVRKTSK